MTRTIRIMTLSLLVILNLCLTQVGWAQEGEPTASAVATSVTPVPLSSSETVLLDDELPAGAATTGTWVWETTQAAKGTRSHGHPSARGQQSHSITFAAPVAIPRAGEIVTSVWLDPADPPRGLMLKLTLDNGDETGVYWEGEEEVFNPGEEEEVWYYGLLPEHGTWTPLSVLAEDLGIEDAKVSKVTFTTHDGRVLWDETIVREAAATPELPLGEELEAP